MSDGILIRFNDLRKNLSARRENSPQHRAGTGVNSAFNIPVSKVFAALIMAIYGFFACLLIGISLQYIPYNTDVAFLRIKQDVIEIPFYKLAFFTHVYTSIFVLPAGFTQFSRYLRGTFPLVHKYNGWLYALVVTCLAGPSGFYMGIYANGGITSQIAFCLLAVLWIFFTVLAVVKVIQGDIKSHREFLIRSFALTLSAMTLRAWKYLLVYLFHPRPMDVYEIVAWLGWIPNLIIAELIIRKFFGTKKLGGYSFKFNQK